MQPRPKDLPDYGNPPVTEVVFETHFELESPLRVPQIGLYWSTIQNDFPGYEEHPPLPDLQEQFGEPLLSPSEVHLQVVSRPGLPRCWFLSESGNKLIQVQEDRFVHNWRKVSGDEDYPRFENIGAEFFQRWEEFAAFVQGQGLGRPRTKLGSLTYVNHIAQGTCWSEIKDVAEAFTFVCQPADAEFLPASEGVEVTLRFALPEGGGRLHVNLRPVMRPEDKQILLRFVLTCRGPLVDVPEEETYLWFQTAREWIVRGFTDLTTPKAHKYWQRRI